MKHSHVGEKTTVVLYVYTNRHAQGHKKHYKSGVQLNFVALDVGLDGCQHYSLKQECQLSTELEGAK